MCGASARVYTVMAHVHTSLVASGLDVHHVGCLCVWLPLPVPTGDNDSTMGNYLDKNSRSLRRRERRLSYTHTAAPVLGPRAVTLGGRGGEYRPVSVDVSSTASCAAPPAGVLAAKVRDLGSNLLKCPGADGHQTC